MIAALLPLIPLLAPLVPRIAEWIGGDDAEEVARQVTGAVTAVAGSTDPAAVAAVIADPARGGQLAAELARIAAERARAEREAEVAEITARLSDIANARQQTVALAQSGHAMAWMPALVTVALFGVFVWTLERLFSGGLSPQARELSLMLVGSVTTAFGAGVNYWLGSSSGSASKDSRLGALTNAVVAAAPASPPSGARPFAGGGR